MLTKTFNLSMPSKLVDDLDKTAKSNYSSRSEYIKRAVINQMQIDSRLNTLFDNSNSKGKKLGITSEQQVYDILSRM
jgi:metal-responsive CopG/Arc/MetJ family transcriptional regulator